MTGDDETFKELTSSIEAFERTVRTRSQPKKPDPKPPDPELQPREAAQPVGLASPTGSFATARATQSPRGWRSRGDLTLVVLAGLLLLSGLLYFGRGGGVESLPPVDGSAVQVGVIDSAGGEPAETTAEREQVARDAVPAPSGVDSSVEASRLATTDRGRVAAPGTVDRVGEVAVPALTGRTGAVERDERDREAEAPALAEQEADWATQVAAYAARGLATVLAARLVDAGYPAYVVDARLDADRTVFRVRIGTYPDRQAAEAVGQRVLEEEGLGWYVLRGR